MRADLLLRGSEGRPQTEFMTEEALSDVSLSGCTELLIRIGVSPNFIASCP
jgi:hypothetical protein